MKTFFAFMFTSMLLVACGKDCTVAVEEKSKTTATVDYMGDPAYDGYGWVLRTANTFEVPTNLAEEFRVDELKVDVVYTKSNVVFPCRCTNRKYMVNIVTIARSL